MLSRLGQLPLIKHTTVRWEGAAKRESERRWVCVGNGYGLGRAGGAAGGNRLDHVLCMQAWTFSRWPSVSALHPVSQSAPGLRAWPANHAFLHRFRTRHVRIHRVRVLPCARCGLHPRTHARTHARTDTVPKHVGAFLQTKQCACAPEHGRAELCRALSHKIAIAYCVSRCVCASSTRCSVRA